MTVFHGTKHDDTFNESSDTTSDTFQLFKGGNDTVIAGSGDDTFKMGAALNAADRLDGGGGKDVVFLHGDYSAGVTFDDDTIQNIEVLRLGKGFNYNLTLTDGNVAARDTLTINASKLGAGNSLTFDGSAESDGHFAIYGGAGNDTLTGGARVDVFHLETGGTDTAHGGGGNDTFDLGGAFTRNDAIDGGTGNDTVVLDGMGDDAISFTATTMTGVETLVLGAGHFYTLTTDDATVAAGATLTVDATALGAGDPLIFNGSHETDGNFVFAFGGGFTATDTITGGAGNDTLSFDGTYASLALSSTKLASLESLAFTGAHAYTGVSIAGDIAGGSTLTINASAASSLSIDLSAATSAAYAITGSGGADTFKFGTSFLASDTIDGGAGNDTLALSGGDDILFGATTLTSVETLSLSGGAYDITTNDGNVAAGKTLTVDATALTTAQALDFNGAAEQDGNFVFEFGANFIAGDTITGGAGNDTLSFSGTQTRTLSSTAISSIETLDLNGGGTTTITGDIAGGSTLTINSVNRLSLDLTAATSSAYVVSITGGISSTITFGGNFTASDVIHDTQDSGNLFLDGDYSGGLTLSGTNLSGIQDVKFEDGFSYAVSVVGLIGQSGSGFVAFRPEVNAGHSVSLDLTQSTASKVAVIQAGTGDASVKFAGNLHATDSISGSGSMTVELDGDYSSGFTFSGSGGDETLFRVNTLKLDDGFSYKLTMAEDNNGLALTVDASALTTGHTLNFDGTNDPNSLIFKFGGNFTTADVLKGGSGTDTLELNGEYHNGTAYTFAANQLAGIDTLKLDAGHDYSLTWNDSDLASGQTLTVDFSALTTGGVSFNGIAEQDGNFHFIVGDALQVILRGGAGNDVFDLTQANGTVELDGQGGNDTFLVGANFNNFSVLGGIDGGAGNDTLEFNGDYSSIIVGTDESNIETIRFDGGHSYGNVTISEGISPALVTVDASQVSTLFHLTLDTTAYLVEVGSGGMVASIGDGGTHDDTFIVTSEAALSASTLDAGAGTDTLELNGDFSLGLTFGATTIANFETIKLDDGNSYSLGTADANVAAGATLTIDASALTGSNILSFGGTAETDGHFAFIGGAGADIITGGKLSDTFDLSLSNGAFVSGFDGNDSFTVTTAAQLLSDNIDGGAGTDTLILNGDFSTQTALTASNLTSIETVQLLGATNNYNLSFFDGIATNVTIDASAAASLTFDGSGAVHTAFGFEGSAGDDHIVGGGLEDFFFGSLGKDTFTGGGGGNDYFYSDASASTTASLDSITDYVAGSDFFQLGFGSDTSFQGEFNSAAATGTLDGDIAAAFNGHGGGVNSFYVFDFTGADFAGRSFLVADSNGNGQYDAGVDFVIELTGHTGPLTTADFDFV